MHSGKASDWLLRGAYRRLYLPVLLIILVVTTVRYHYLVDEALDEARRHAQSELQRAGTTLMPDLAALPPGSSTAETSALLRAGSATLGPQVRALAWHVADSPGTDITLALPAAQALAPAWFTRWVNMPPPVQQFVHTPPSGRMARLTVTLHPEPLVHAIWSSLAAQARFTALNIFTILFLLTLLLRANARLLQRLAAATHAFRRGHLGTRMPETGTLESRAMASAFNDMATKVQSLVLSLRESQQMHSEQQHFTRQLVDSLQVPVLVRDRDGRCLESNRAWRQLFPPASAPGHGATAGHDASLPELAPELCSQIAQSQDNEICVHRAHLPPLYFACYESPFTRIDGTQAGTICTLVDVTERKRAQEAQHAEKERAALKQMGIGDGATTTHAANHLTRDPLQQAPSEVPLLRADVQYATESPPSTATA
ncbi:PAS domain-containing protein [Paracidovorax sp. MALMAid1276]|uniref:PAS domain-containing protein n=1 Tax=Paracidovorax sp. MALMAid1276 TaxID=3411631 RepID=UPI003B9C9563